MELSHKGTKNIESSRLIFSEFLISDAKEVYTSYSASEEVCRYLLIKPHPDIETTERIIAGRVMQYGNPEFYHWKITEKQSGEIIGACMANCSNGNLSCEIGFIFAKRRWGNGFASETAKRISDFFLNEVGVMRCGALCDFRNEASRRALLKAGFKEEGLLRNYYRDLSGESRDYYILSRVKNGKD